MILTTFLLIPVIGIAIVQATTNNSTQVKPLEDTSNVPQLFTFGQYPKLVVEYTATLEPTDVPAFELEIARALDDVYDDFKQSMRDAMNRNPITTNAEITAWHFHRSNGAVDEAERPTITTSLFWRPLILNVNSPAVQGIPLQADGFPNGISQYDLRIFFDPGFVDIVNVVFPPLGNGVVNSQTSDSVSISFSDLGNQLQSGLENIAIIEVTSVAEGAAQIDIEIDVIQDNDGNPIVARAFKGLVEVR